MRFLLLIIAIAVSSMATVASEATLQHQAGPPVPTKYRHNLPPAVTPTAMRMRTKILMLLASSPALAGDQRVGGFKPAIEKPRMHFADTVSGKPFSKDPAVVRFQGRYWLD